MLILHHAGLFTIVFLDFPVVCQVLSLAFLFSSSFSPHPLLKKENVWQWAAVGTLTVSYTITNNSYLAPITSPLKKKKGISTLTSAVVGKEIILYLKIKGQGESNFYSI